MSIGILQKEYIDFYGRTVKVYAKPKLESVELMTHADKALVQEKQSEIFDLLKARFIKSCVNMYNPYDLLYIGFEPGSYTVLNVVYAKVARGCGLFGYDYTLRVNRWTETTQFFMNDALVDTSVEEKHAFIFYDSNTRFYGTFSKSYTDNKGYTHATFMGLSSSDQLFKDFRQKLLLTKQDEIKSEFKLMLKSMNLNTTGVPDIVGNEVDQFYITMDGQEYFAIDVKMSVKTELVYKNSILTEDSLRVLGVDKYKFVFSSFIG